MMVGSTVRFCWTALFFVLVTGLGTVASVAQEARRLGAGAYGVQYRPEAADYRVFETDHFDLVYQTGAEEMARRTAIALEESWARTNALVGAVPPDLHMPVVINNYNDRSNGFVHPFPFRQEIEAPSIKSDPLVARSTNWPTLVGPHELVHAAHAEVKGGIGMGGLLRPFAPDIARTLNLVAPSGLIEGVAVYRESQIEPGAGRLNAPLFEMKMKAAMLSEDPWTLTQMMESPAYTQPFNRFYIGGAHAFQYLAERGDSVSTDFFRSTVTWHNRLPFVGHGVWLGLSTGQSPNDLRDEIQRALRQDYRQEVDARKPFTALSLVSGKPGLNHRRPYWLDETTLVAYLHGYDVRPGFYRIDAATGERTPIRIQELTEDRTYSLGPDTTALYAARYVSDPLVPRQALAEVERVDLAGGDATQLTDGGRALAPAVGQQGQVYAVTNDGPFTRWSVVTDDGDTRPLTPEITRSIRQIAPSPRDSTVAVLVNEGGEQRLYRARAPLADAAQLRPWLGLRDAVIYDVCWGPEGRYLLFAADLDGTANIFAYDTQARSVLKLANVQFGALEPALSPDRSTLAFVNYQHERHDLVRMPFRPDSATVVSDSLVLNGNWSEEGGKRTSRRADVTIDSSQTRSYSAWRHLSPRMVYPTLHGEGNEEPLPFLETPAGAGPLGVGVGIGVQGSDPLQQWAYQGTAYWQNGRLWSEARLQSGEFLLRPSLSLYDRAETRCCLSGRLVGAEERGAGLNLRLPITVESNVYRSVLRFGVDTEVRQTRFFDGPLPEPTPYTTRVTLNPTVVAGYRLQQNPRDVVPNTGFVAGAQGEFDAWTERGSGSQYVRPFLDVYLPVLRASNTGIRLGARALIQNEGALVNTTTFVPRGYGKVADVLAQGTFLQLEAEVTQPVWYIDDGLTIFPLYAKALSVYGFGETLGRVDDGGWRHTFSSVGGGLSLQTRLFYALDVTFRIGVAYKPQTQEVTAIGR
jgi:hypothetical protein